MLRDDEALQLRPSCPEDARASSPRGAERDPHRGEGHATWPGRLAIELHERRKQPEQAMELAEGEEERESGPEPHSQQLGAF